MTETIDLTPESLKTPEGAARVNAALKDAENSRARLEMAAVMFFREHLETLVYALKHLGEDGETTLEDLNELRPLLDARHEAHDKFARALAGR